MFAIPRRDREAGDATATTGGMMDGEWSRAAVFIAAWVSLPLGVGAGLVWPVVTGSG